MTFVVASLADKVVPAFVERQYEDIANEVLVVGTRTRTLWDAFVAGAKKGGDGKGAPLVFTWLDSTTKTVCSRILLRDHITQCLFGLPAVCPWGCGGDLKVKGPRSGTRGDGRRAHQE